MDHAIRRTGPTAIGIIGLLCVAAVAFPAPVLADPPPWAPAHGHRGHQEPPVVVYPPPVHVYYPPPAPVYVVPPPVYYPPPGLTITVPLR